MVNNKIYIGSSNNLYRRKVHNHFYKLSLKKHDNVYLQNSYNYHGEQNFIFEVIEFVENEDELLEHEQYWLDKFYSKDFCYNINPNADKPLNLKGKLNHNYGKPSWNKGLSWSEEVKAKMRKPKTLEHRKKISESRKGKYCGKNSYMYGKHHSEETKRKMKENHADISGENHPFYGKFGKYSSNHVKVVCLELGKIYEAIIDASRDLGAHPQSISDCCRNKYYKTVCKSITGNPKFHFMYYSDYIQLTPEQIQEKLNK